MDVDPLLDGALQAADAMPRRVIENLGAATRDGIEPGIAEPRDGVAQAESAYVGDVGHLGRREAVQMDGKPFLDAAEEILVPFNFEIGVEAALHENPGPSQIESLLDFVEDYFLREDVAFSVTHGAIERAEGAIFRAEIRVVDI